MLLPDGAPTPVQMRSSSQPLDENEAQVVEEIKGSVVMVPHKSGLQVLNADTGDVYSPTVVLTGWQENSSRDIQQTST